MAKITIPHAYEGIGGVAHGGYVAGRLAAHADGPVEVSLRRPPPVDTPLTVTEADGALELRDPGGGLVGEARTAEPSWSWSPAVTLDEAASRQPAPGYGEHPFPGCFVCGTARTDGFGLRVSAPDDADVVAGVWTPTGPLLPDGPEVPAEFLWAVVDCTTAWSFSHHWGDPAWWPALTGRIAVVGGGPVSRCAPHLVAGRVVGRQGRRVTVEAAVVDVEGRALAQARAVWVVVDALPAAAGR